MNLQELSSALVSFEQDKSGLAEQQLQLTAAEGVVEECSRRVLEVRSLLAAAEATLLQAEQTKRTLAASVEAGRTRYRTQEAQIYAAMADMVARFQGGAKPVTPVTAVPLELATEECEPGSVIPGAIQLDPEPIPAAEAVVYSGPLAAMETPVMEHGEVHQVEEVQVPATPVSQELPAPVAPAAPQTGEKQPGVLLSLLNRLTKGGGKQTESKPAPGQQTPPVSPHTSQTPPTTALRRVVGGGPIFTIE